MRVAILGPYPSNRDRIVGGVEAVVVYLSDELSRHPGVELHIITGSPDQGSETVACYKGLTVHHLPRSRRFASITSNWADVRRMVKKVKQIDPDVVHAQGITAQADAALSSGYPAVITVHGIVEKDLRFEPGAGNRLRAILSAHGSRRNLERADHLIAISPYVIEEFGALLKSRVYMVENPIHRKFYEIDNRSVPTRVLFAGRVIRRKCVLELLRSLSEVRQQFPDVELRIAGDTSADPTYYRLVLDYIAQSHLQGNVRFLGSLDEHQLVDEYSTCAFVVLTSIQETSPMVIQQAMAAGRSVVSTRICGIPYLIVDGETGLLVEVGDTSAFARAMIALLTDRVRREEMGRRARRIASRFRADEVARKTLDVYDGILNRR